MKTCLICPVPSLRDYVDEKCTHHLLLAHLLLVPGYVEFYRERAERGDYIILDNGAKEMGTGLSMKSVLAGAKLVGAKEVVLTDVRFKSRETTEAAETELDWMMSPNGRRAYEEAGHPKLMIVPQGKTVSQWLDCLKFLTQIVNDCMAVVPDMPEPSVAYAYHYDHFFRGGLDRLLSMGRPAEDIHFLGWTRNLGNLLNLTLKYPYVRSVDSGRPFSYAKAGILCFPSAENPGRDPDFFLERMPDEQDVVTRSNIEIFRIFAADFPALDVSKVW